MFKLGFVPNIIHQGNRGFLLQRAYDLCFPFKPSPIDLLIPKTLTQIFRSIYSTQYKVEHATQMIMIHRKILNLSLVFGRVLHF